MTPDAPSLRAAAIRDCEGHYAERHVNTIPPCAESMAEARWWAQALAAAPEQPPCHHDAKWIEQFTDWVIRAYKQQTPATGGLDVDGVVAELMGVEAHLDEARERLIKVNATLAGIANAATLAGGEDEPLRSVTSGGIGNNPEIGLPPATGSDR